jgi:uncharacterized membrane protein
VTPRTAARCLAAVFLTTGTTHFAKPSTYEPLVPPLLPGSARSWVYASGVAELGCAAALAVEATRRQAATASAALPVAVFPGNVWMAWRWRHRPAPALLAAIARLPLQAPLVAWARYSARP